VAARLQLVEQALKNMRQWALSDLSTDMSKLEKGADRAYTMCPQVPKPAWIG